MKREINIQSEIIILLLGIIFVLIALAFFKPTSSPFNNELYFTILISIGCSVLATAIASLFLRLPWIRNKFKRLKQLRTMGINNIYATRAAMNVESNEKIEDAKTEIDICALGLTGFRDQHEDLIRKKLKQGVKIRILAPSPTSPFLSQIDNEEQEKVGKTKDNIERLIKWVSQIKETIPESNKDLLQVKVHSLLPPSSYMRVDNSMFTGPNMYGKRSQQTISFSFVEGEALNIYKKLFNTLWENSDTPNFLQK